MMNRSIVRVAATIAAIASAITADGQQTDARRVGAELNQGRQLSLYVPETRLVVATEPVRLAQATPAELPAPPARLPDTAGWTPLLVVFGVLALIGAILLMTRRRMRRLPGDLDRTDAFTEIGRQGRLAAELKALWDKTTTSESLRPMGAPKTVPK